MADKYEGKRLNAPNDIIVKSDDTIWFSDPLFGINGEWEGKREKPEQATTNVYRIGTDGKVTAVITDLVNPNGLAFSPDEKKLYVVEARGTPTAVSGATMSTPTERWAPRPSLSRPWTRAPWTDSKVIATVISGADGAATALCNLSRPMSAAASYSS